MPYLTGRQNTATLDRMVQENRNLDARLAAEEDLRLRQRNEDIYLLALRSFFMKTDR